VTARAVQKALPYPWRELFEFVEGSDRQSAYWRTSQDRSAIRSEADREHKLQFSEAAKNTEGVEGTVERDGKTIPASAAQIGEEVSSTESDSTSSTGFGQRALARLEDILGR
jgi:hypothetical protein